MAGLWSRASGQPRISEGNIEHAVNGAVRGWLACTGNASTERLLLHIDGALSRGRTVVQSRPDAQAHVSRGTARGFTFMFRATSGSRMHRTVVVTCECGTRLQRTVSDGSWRNAFVGEIEAVEDGWARGWMLDLARPRDPAPTVVVMPSGHVMEALVPDVTRPDLRVAFGDTAPAGFHWAHPALGDASAADLVLLGMTDDALVRPPAAEPSLPLGALCAPPSHQEARTRTAALPSADTWQRDWLLGRTDEQLRARAVDALEPAVAEELLLLEALRRVGPGAHLLTAIHSAEAAPGSEPAALTGLQEAFATVFLSASEASDLAVVVVRWLTWLRPLAGALALVPEGQLQWLCEQEPSAEPGVNRYVAAREAVEGVGRRSALVLDELLFGYGSTFTSELSLPPPSDPDAGQLEARACVRALARGRSQQVVAGTPDITVLGLLGHQSAIGATADRSVAVLSAAGLAPASVRLDFGKPLVGRELQAVPAPTGGVALLHVQAEYLAGLFTMAAAHLSGYDRRIAYVAWEAEEVPQALVQGLQTVDEVWTPSTFSTEAFRRHHPRVLTVPPWVDVSRVEPVARSVYGGRAESFVVHYAFDVHSTLARKNPADVVRAFRTAFPRDEEALLLLRVRNLDSARAAGAAGDRRAGELLELIQSDPRIRVIGGEHSHAWCLGLMATADCYLSLHRSEGFGYTMAEAMALGVPVVGTRYSGNLDFMNDDDAWLVDAQLEPVDPGEYPLWTTGMVWAQPDVFAAAQALRAVRFDPDGAAVRVHAAYAAVSRRHDLASTVRQYRWALAGTAAD